MVEIQKKSIGGATGSNYTGVVNREEECNYMTLCEHGGSKVSGTIFSGFDFEIINFIFEFAVIILLRDN